MTCRNYSTATEELVVLLLVLLFNRFQNNKVMNIEKCTDADSDGEITEWKARQCFVFWAPTSTGSTTRNFLIFLDADIQIF